MSGSETHIEDVSSRDTPSQAPWQKLYLWWSSEDCNRVIWTTSAALLTFLVWAAFFPLDVASYAQGQVIPAGQLKRIQHLEGGSFAKSRSVKGRSWRLAMSSWS